MVAMAAMAATAAMAALTALSIHNHRQRQYNERRLIINYIKIELIRLVSTIIIIGLIGIIINLTCRSNVGLKNVEDGADEAFHP